ncbi:hypothetical protein [Poseidonibacter ostreae]|jgi:hypothetical protein|uniref:Uncharacterized protein n=1 Tax=Poseidonibacter ostreae TaxID=2654171 RepID=A0A6L4WQA5_9BACT|nr:hypothetical protein [Poseidonibacter ostreae]KAB7886360.1 hypothetical protein GBG19_12255 [Poseidonibacter ostreae]KAB7887475.1 hypothetical protein GA417_02205 [Poseidonibacter ostreae]KAB7891855.1 hypothetical protein GBG18_05310 [Poseidonibacter ostreae]MAC82828.1 hypothetical protein [Arcobacter sp.]
MDKEQLNDARTNPDFLKYLEEARVKSIAEKNINVMYETLDSMLILDLDEEKINKLYEEILKTSFENVEKIVNKNEKLKLENENLLYVRAFYEHAIEKWSYDNFDGAKELVFVLANITDDEPLEKALNVLLIVLSTRNQLDFFYDTSVDHEKESSEEKYGYFIMNFKFNTDEFLNDNKETLEKEYKNLKHLLDS